MSRNSVLIFVGVIFLVGAGLAVLTRFVEPLAEQDEVAPKTPTLNSNHLRDNHEKSALVNSPKSNSAPRRSLPTPAASMSGVDVAPPQAISPLPALTPPEALPARVLSSQEIDALNQGSIVAPSVPLSSPYSYSPKPTQ